MSHHLIGRPADRVFGQFSLSPGEVKVDRSTRSATIGEHVGERRRVHPWEPIRAAALSTIFLRLSLVTLSPLTMTSVIEYAEPADYDSHHTERGRLEMPMIDVYSTEGTFADKHSLASDLANAVMRWEKVPPISLFKNNTAAFVHDLPEGAISNAAGETNYVRVQVLTPIGVLDREKQLGVVRELTDIVAAAAGDPELDRTHVGPHHRVARRRVGHQRSREHQRRHRASRARRVGEEGAVVTFSKKRLTLSGPCLASPTCDPSRETRCVGSNSARAMIEPSSLRRGVAESPRSRRHGTSSILWGP